MLASTAHGLLLLHPSCTFYPLSVLLAVPHEWGSCTTGHV